MKDRFSKTCLGLIVLLLAVIALRPSFTPQPVHAAQQKYEYAVNDWHDFDIPVSAAGKKVLQKQMDEASGKGWELEAVVPITLGGQARQLLLIWKSPL